MSIGNPVMVEVIKEANKFLCILFLKGQSVLVDFNYRPEG